MRAWSRETAVLHHDAAAQELVADDARLHEAEAVGVRELPGELEGQDLAGAPAAGLVHEGEHGDARHRPLVGSGPVGDAGPPPPASGTHLGARSAREVRREATGRAASAPRS